MYNREVFDFRRTKQTFLNERLAFLCHILVVLNGNQTGPYKSTMTWLIVWEVLAVWFKNGRLWVCLKLIKNSHYFKCHTSPLTMSLFMCSLVFHLLWVPPSYWFCSIQAEHISSMTALITASALFWKDRIDSASLHTIVLFSFNQTSDVWSPGLGDP